MAKGKYEQWLTEEGLLQLEAWARNGLTDEQIAANIGCACSTLYDWKGKYSEISEALKRGKEVVDIEVENALLKRALGYDYTEERVERSTEGGKKSIKTVQTVKHIPPDTTAQIFWLKNRRPDRWRDKQQVEHSGTLEVESPFAGLTTEELRKLAESYLPALEELEAQRALLRQKQQILSDGDRRLRTQLSDLLSQVSRWDDSVQSAGDIRRFVRETAQNRDRLAQELQQAQTQLLQAQMSDADDTVTHLQQQIAQVQGRLDAGRDAQALGDQISRLEEELVRQQAEYDALRLSLDALQAANTTLQNRFSPELGRRAAEIFADMTGSTWSHILLDREFHLSAESGSDPTRRSVQLLSAGTADQLYLAVRLAICEMILPPEQNPPLILDDALLTFDDARLSTTLDYLTRLGAQRQILLFTCQGREASLLRGRPGVHITNLTQST